MELLGNILKHSFVIFLVLVLVYINQKIMYKESKQIKWYGFLIAYIIVVTVLVLNEYYGFITHL